MKVLLIRHGEPNYENVTRLGLVSYLGELTKEGVMQAERVSYDDRLKGAEIIVSSPFTRALQTGAIISKNTGIPLTVEPAFHEWLEDYTHVQTLDNEYSKLAYKEFCQNNFELSPSSNLRFESVSQIVTRAYPAMMKYVENGYSKIIVTTHAMLMRTMGYRMQKLPYCTIFEREFDKNSKFEKFVAWKGC